MTKQQRFKSVTTPGKFFYMTGAIAEFVCLQKYGLDLGPKFWYKRSNKPKARKTFLETQKKIYALFKKNEDIKATDFFPIVFNQISKPKINKKKRKGRMTLKEKKRLDALKEQNEVSVKKDQEEGENLITFKTKKRQNIFGENNGTQKTEEE